ncbi:hypothetical protein ANTQUA_LOCUS10039 [Anthophora quadrimaculata]
MVTFSVNFFIFIIPSQISELHSELTSSRSLTLDKSSPDLTSPDYFLWGYIKDKVYRDVPTTPTNMQERIWNVCININRQTLSTVTQAFIKRVEKCLEVGGQHYEHLLK